MTQYLQRVMDIPKLSRLGAQQLSTDIGTQSTLGRDNAIPCLCCLRLRVVCATGYLRNVLSALGVPLDQGLTHVHKLLDASEDQYASRYSLVCQPTPQVLSILLLLLLLFVTASARSPTHRPRNKRLLPWWPPCVASR